MIMKLRIDGASSWFLLHRCIEIHGQQNTKNERPYFTPTQRTVKTIIVCHLCSSRILRSVESQKRADLICIAAEAWSHAFSFVCFYLLKFYIIKREDGWFWNSCSKHSLNLIYSEFQRVNALYFPCKIRYRYYRYCKVQSGMAWSCTVGIIVIGGTECG
jgi:hypothetical protein